MRCTTVLTGALLALGVSARSFNILGSGATEQHPLVDDEPPAVFPVPGENPLNFCEDPSKYLLTIENVNLSPNPPKAGQTLQIRGSGLLSEKIEKGAKAHLTVKYGVVRLINQEADLCDYTGEVDLDCPLNKGNLTLSKDVELPGAIPPGKYTVEADLLTKDERKITCLTAEVTFSRD